MTFELAVKIEGGRGKGDFLQENEFREEAEEGEWARRGPASDFRV